MIKEEKIYKAQKLMLSIVAAILVGLFIFLTIFGAVNDSNDGQTLAGLIGLIIGAIGATIGVIRRKKTLINMMIGILLGILFVKSASVGLGYLAECKEDIQYYSTPEVISMILDIMQAIIVVVMLMIHIFVSVIVKDNKKLIITNLTLNLLLLLVFIAQFIVVPQIFDPNVSLYIDIIYVIYFFSLLSVSMCEMITANYRIMRFKLTHVENNLE